MNDKNQVDDVRIDVLLAYTNSIIAAFKEPFLVLDKNLRVISANQVFYTTFKVTEKATIGRLLSDLDNKQWNIPKLIQLLKKILPEKKVVKDYKVEHKFEQIGEKVMIVNACQLRVPKKIATIIAAGVREEVTAGEKLILMTIEDITKRKIAEDKLVDAYSGLEDKFRERTKELKEAQNRILRSEKMAVVGQLASSVAHELRNPLGVMRNVIYYLNMLELGKDNPDIKEHMDIISSEIENSDKVISDLLEFSRVKDPTLRPEDINAILNEVLSRIKVPSGIELVTKLDNTLPKIAVDALQMQQVFYNISTNAIQAMEKGGNLIILTKLQDNFVEISFADTGSGISQENLTKIFEPLFSTKSKGTGLGLSVVASLVQGHGGKLEVDSDVGKGSIFTVKLPIKRE